MSLPDFLKGVTCSIEHWTVNKAKIALTRNKTNRPKNQENLVFISSEMKRNKWLFTGESVIIASNDDLMNGQHRLESIVITGKEQYFVTVRGVNPKAFSVMDIGKTRSAGDALSIENIVNANSFASIGRHIMMYNMGGFQRMAKVISNKKLLLSPNDIRDFVLKNHVSLTKSREYGFAKENLLLPGNILSVFHYIFKKIDNDAACDFCNKLSDGKELEKTDAIYLLRQELKRDMISQRKMEPLEKMALICKAWNFYRDKKKVNELKFDTKNEDFPKLK